MARALSDTPPSRFPERPIAQAAARWWVAKLKARQEKAFAADLMQRGIEYYLPMVTVVTRRKDNNKPRKSILPLFPGYISFAQNTPQDIYRNGRVAGLIEIRHQARFIHELTQIYQAIESGAQLEPLTDSFEAGTYVRVRSGPMRGVEGQITHVRDQKRLVLEVEPFGRASMVIDSSMVEPL